MKKFVIITVLMSMLISLYAVSARVNYIPLFQYEQHSYGS